VGYRPVRLRVVADLGTTGRVIRSALALALVLAAAGCGGDDDPPPTSAPAAPTSASPSPSTSAPPVHPLGTAVDDNTNGFRITATVHAYRQPSAPNTEKPADGGEWGSADVQVCIHATPADVPATVSWRPWALVYTDGGVVKAADVEYGTFPKPQQPNDDRVIPPGRCVRGWVTFPARAGTRPAMVEYQPQGVVIDWAAS
jgi:hypothetical protein